MGGLYFTGLGSGIDTDAMVKYLMELEGLPLQRAAIQKKELQEKESCWQEIRSRLMALEQSACELQRGSLYGQKKAVFDSEGLAAAAVSAAAAGGSYRLEIVALAQAHSMASSAPAGITGDAGAGSDSALGLSGSLRINDQEIAVSEGDSMRQICNRINELEELGATAAIIDGRLVLTRKETGATEIEVDEAELSASLGLHTIQEARDAIVKVNGLEAVRPGNTINDLLEGVSLKLLKAGEKPFTMTVADDQSPLIGKIENFIRQYNSTYQFARVQLAADPKTGARGTLHGESSLNQVLASIRRIVTGLAGMTGDLNSLAAIGISTAAWDSAEAEGTLVLDEAKLKGILGTEPEAVADLLSGGGGVAGRLGSYLVDLTRSGEGLIHSRSKGIENRIKELDRRTEGLERRLEKREQTLRGQFLAAERIINEMNSQGQWLDQQLNLLSRWAAPDARSR